MSDTIRLSRTDTYEHTISGLLKKRADLFNEAERIRDRMAEIRNDIGALDRVLGTLGYTGDLDAEMPRQKRHVLFGRGELTRAILGELRDASKPLGSGEIAQAVVAVSGQDARDRRLLGDLTKRVSKALGVLHAEGAVSKIRGPARCFLWRIRDLTLAECQN
jgi:hypothetical protein